MLRGFAFKKLTCRDKLEIDPIYYLKLSILVFQNRYCLSKSKRITCFFSTKKTLANLCLPKEKFQSWQYGIQMSVSCVKRKTVSSANPFFLSNIFFFEWLFGSVFWELLAKMYKCAYPHRVILIPTTLSFLTLSCFIKVPILSEKKALPIDIP